METCTALDFEDEIVGGDHDSNISAEFKNVQKANVPGRLAGCLRGRAERASSAESGSCRGHGLVGEFDL